MAMWFSENTLPKREIAVKSGLIFSVLMTASIGIAVGLYLNERREQTTLLQSSERQYVDALGEIVVANLKAVASDLMILAEGRTLAAVLSEDDEQARANLAEEFRLVAGQTGLYDQIRYLSDDGQEVVRVNLRDGRAEVVPQSQLQSKKDRYYFQQTLELDRNEVYLSPFDLNVENGQIEQPPKPTIRFGTPVFDAAGRKRGVVIVNYLGQRLLELLDSSAARQPGQIMLLNDQGFWLKSPQPEKQWAFMYENRSDRSFAVEFPDVWRELSAVDHGQVRTSAGTFTLATVHPVRRLHDGAAHLSAQHGYHWKLVSHVPPEQLAARSDRVLYGILSLLAGVAGLLAAVSWLLARSLVHQRETRKKLIQHERLAAIGTAMTALAHESRNALQRSQAGLEMLARRLPSDDDSHELLDELQEAQYYLRDIYEQVRDWAAPLQPQVEQVEIPELARTVWEQLARVHRERDDRLEIDATDTKAVCEVDRRMIGQVLRNLFENSLAAAAPAYVRVHCQSNVTGDATLITISDNGPGLTDEQYERLFEPFFSTQMRGTGLGMAICRRLVEAHGGSIRAREPSDSRPSTGTEIVIELPKGTE